MEYSFMGNRGSFNNNLSSFNRIFYTVADDKPQVIKWLSSLQPQKRHQHLRESRLDGVGQWVFRTSEFRRWNTGEDGSSHPVLFCPGDPGVGKTHLSSLIIDHFYGKGPDIAVAGLYCDYLDRKEQTTSNMLGAVLRQLVGRGNIPVDIRKAFEDAMGHFGGVGPRVPELLNMLKTAIAQRQRVVICVDGLDESLGPHRTGLLRSLQGIVRELPNVRLFLTGRPFISSEVEKYFPGAETITVSPTKGDIEAFLRMKLEEDTEFDAMDERLSADIMGIIPETISDIFLLVSLSIEAILAETTIHLRREKLKQMSRGHDVGDVYTSTLERIRAQKNGRSRLGMGAIMWVAYSEQPLQPDELCQALGVEIGSKDLNNDNAPSIRTILSCGLGLITVDSSSSTVRLVHFTLQEYILANPGFFYSPHLAIAEVCLTYLNLTSIRDLSPSHPPPMPTTPFLEYASCYWGAHARRETNGLVVSLALKLLDQFDTHTSCKLLLQTEYPPDCPFSSEDRPVGFTGLHCGAYLGVTEIMIALFGIKEWDLNAVDSHGNTALAWAVRKGHDCIVKLLLEMESVNPDMANNSGRTPFSWAAGKGHEGIVKMLLGKSDVDVGRVDASGRTPLSWACGDGREGVVKVLLERNDVNPNAANEYGQTPLSWAAKYGCEGVVETLLERIDVNPNAADYYGRTPLSWAAKYGREGVVKMLLERNDVNPNIADKRCRTPFSWAAEYGRDGTVKMLLERNDVNPGIVDKSGQTPFSLAALRGHEEIVKILLQRKDVDTDTVDEYGRTPLSFAALSGREGVVKILLERNDVYPDKADKSGRTPFLRAAEHGCEGIVKLLLERNDVNPDEADTGGRTPLSWAAENGQKGVVEMLLQRNDVHPDKADRSARTPLLWAAESGHEGIVKILLQRSHPDPGMAHGGGRTQSSRAAGNVCAIALPPPERHDFVAESALSQGSPEPPTAESSDLPEPPLKLVRRF